MAGNSQRHQRLSVLQQIEELKNWHKQQESKLNSKSPPLSKNYSTNTSNGTFKKNTDTLGIYEENNHFTNPNKQNFDEIPIKTSNFNFNVLVEKNLPPIEQSNSVADNTEEKPKFKFLKKGEGIARFRMGPQKSLKSRSKTKQLPGLSSITNRDNQNEYKENIKPQSEKENVGKSDEALTLQPPDLKLNFKNWKSIFSNGNVEEMIENAIENNQLELFQPNSSIDSSTASMMEKIISFGKKHIREKEELRIYEAVEQHVLDSSFCSTSSYITRLMENAVMSTPVKSSSSNRTALATHHSTNQLLISANQDHQQERCLGNNIEMKRPEPPTWSKSDTNTQPDNKQDHTSDAEQSLHVKFSEEVDYKSFVEYSQSNNSLPQETETREEYDESEEWKEDSGEGSCCSHGSTMYSSSDEDVRAISPPTKPCEASQKNELDCTKIQGNNCNFKSTDKLDIKELQTKNIESCVSPVDNQSLTPALKTKLKELEDEIQIFCAENQKLKAIREKLEKEHKEFQREKKKLLKEVEEEKKKYIAEIEEEKQKLARERFIREKYSKNLSKNPTKEERKEIQALKDQLKEMKEELNKKETRWGAAQARVRNQVKLLEEDNKKLREEVEILRKQAKHLELLALKKKGKPFNNTKLIHAFNDHLSKLIIQDDDDDDKTKCSTENGYFKQKKSVVKTVDIEEVDPNTNYNIKVIKEVTPNTALTAEYNKCNQQYMEPSHKQVMVNGSKEYVPSSRDILCRQYEDKIERNPLSFEEDKEKNYNSQSTGRESPTSPRETVNADGSLERIDPDGKKEIRYKNGVLKKIDPFTGTEKTIYPNNDVKEVTNNGTVKYYYSEDRVWQTTFPDGMEVFDFPNGQIEKRHINGKLEIIFPNGCKKITFPDGSQEIYYSNGNKCVIESDKRKVLFLPNGQKEIQTEEFTRREYPDGTVKTVYPDGVTQTIYANGRVRVRDKHGNLVMDSGAPANGS